MRNLQLSARTELRLAAVEKRQQGDATLAGADLVAWPQNLTGNGGRKCGGVDSRDLNRIGKDGERCAGRQFGR
ncbi:MAG: hypothetical protein NVSMB2_25120 [Chloroflexota bacterium]